MAVFTGIFFLNMSFFLAEISALELDKTNKQLVENLVRSFSCASEEERDASGGESHDSSSPSAKEVDMIAMEHNRTLTGEFVLLLKKYLNNADNLHKSVSSETPSQPPES